MSQNNCDTCAHDIGDLSLKCENCVRLEDQLIRKKFDAEEISIVMGFNHLRDIKDRYHMVMDN